MGVGGGMVVAVAVAEAAALFAVASKAELRFIAIKSFVLSATVDAVTMHLSGLSDWAGRYHDKN